MSADKSGALSDADLDALEAAAQTAARSHLGHVGGRCIFSMQIDPQTILRLLSSLRELREALSTVMVCGHETSILARCTCDGCETARSLLSPKSPPCCEAAEFDGPYSARCPKHERPSPPADCEKCRGRGVDSDEPACGPTSHAWSSRAQGDPIEGLCVWCGQPRCPECNGTGKRSSPPTEGRYKCAVCPATFTDLHDFDNHRFIARHDPPPTEGQT